MARLPPALLLERVGGLYAVRAFLDEIEAALPEAERRAALEKDALASELGYDKDPTEVDRRFFWVQRLLAHSVLILLASLVETQLTDLARLLRSERGAKLRPKEIAGDPVTKAKTYLTKVVELPIANDQAWETLRDLAELRNVVVHRRGVQGPEREQQRKIQRLLKCYEGDLFLRGPADNANSEICVSPALCRRFLDEIEAFFRRLIHKAGLEAPSLREH